MQTRLSPENSNPAGEAAAALLGRCVHCGFCTATCPTYQLLGDELDGPRGRIDLIRQLLEGGPSGTPTRLHLDRCLSCRACETTCPSGVEYGRLLDSGRQLLEIASPRPWPRRLARRALASVLTGPWFAPLLRMAQLLRGVLPRHIARRVPARRFAGNWPARRHASRVLLLRGCVQPAMAPNIDAATARVFDALGLETVSVPGSGCCGAIRQHLSDEKGALVAARRNVDAWWPLLEGGTEAIVASASGCGAMLREYGYLLRNDPDYAVRAAAVSARVRDPVELIAPRLDQLQARLRDSPMPRIVFHPPCSLQHAQKLRGAVEGVLGACGVQLLPVADSHLCCGSAGTYSLLQPRIATQLRDKRLQALQAGNPERVLSANLGCMQHLASGTDLPVQHWLEWLDERLATDTV
jgi:glycolate oxidase iron-sulfur subunit